MLLYIPGIFIVYTFFFLRERGEYGGKGMEEFGLEHKEIYVCVVAGGGDTECV